ncbi:putative DNA-binding transcriptional regulator YafY [Algoriphagus ratkowskyi]|uniref:Putative DNA-binding transcriptional regulator YafY n=1 Tax=Algoriphagus ratkowskyi TaxID=57028 RepID=A0A2W7RJU6_9BACT|nr:YafY family protein [Algoriphagus ratkowskyi]PZX59286.1 putative DNA-binding transcriptional regulator YafY [Algoriphagus ratkowskyi]TXD77444.1 YafY family transcriptional regulator [Algoriphagus ratkowskyi]
MNRIDRLTAILTHLQSKRTVRASELAARFEVSLRTIYRDVRSLEESGVPVIGEAGQGYSLVEGYRLPPIMFSREEALAMLVAEKLMEKALGEQTSKHFNNALIKIKAVLKSTEKDLLVEVQDTIKVLKSSSSPNMNQSSKAFQFMLQAISDKNVVATTYVTFDPEQITERELEPVGMFHSYEQWYLMAFCRMRRDYRTFRLDRFSKFRFTDISYSTAKHPSLQSYLDKVAGEQKLHQIVLEVPDGSLKYLANSKYNNGFVSEEKVGERTVMTFMNSSIEGFVRWVISLGDMVVIKKPTILRVRLSELLNEIKQMQE